jgi:hypothetical protein
VTTDQLQAWRQAIAAHNRAKRNRRGRRNRDPYARSATRPIHPAPTHTDDREAEDAD